MKLIEQMTCLSEMEDDKHKLEMFDKMYMIAHVANWTCLNPHKDWKEEVDKLIEEFNNY